MKYNFFIENNSLIITNGQRVILSGIKIRINYMRSKDVLYVPHSLKEDGNVTAVEFERYEPRDWMNEADRVNIVFTEEKGVLLSKADFACAKAETYNFTYFPFESAFIDYTVPEDKEGMLNLHTQNPFWLNPSFAMDTKDFKIDIGSLSYKIKDSHIHLLPLVNNKVRTHIEKTGFVIDTCVANTFEISADVFVISSDDSPFSAINNCFEVGRELNAITTPSATERKYPKEFEGFGWCTWNAFYFDVTSDKIYQKLDELKSKGVKIKWLLVDDGWLSVKDRKLFSFKEDQEKFPEGFKNFTKKVKEEYGVKYIGVWHAFQGYWQGFHKDGEIYRDYKDCLYETPTGWIVPSENEEKAFKLWDAWHSYLKEQGIDFVKVDNQTSSSSKYEFLLPGATAVSIQHAALERSVFKNFGGAIINCMGAKMENILTRPKSAVNRNSDDYYPNKEHGFINHINQNVYTAPVHSNVHICDYDMFWTEHETATVSAVLRAISGGPVYVSDEVGKTNADELKPLVTPNGDVWRFDTAAMVTKDLFYTECSSAETPLKVWSRSGNNFVLAAFGITVDKTVKGSFKLKDIPNTADRYLVHDYFENKYFVLDREGEVPLETPYNTCTILSLYPISDGSAIIGDGSYYAEAADPSPKKVAVKEIVKP